MTRDHSETRWSLERKGEMRCSRALIGFAAALSAVAVGWTRRAMRWGATPEEIRSQSTGDDWFEGTPAPRLRMTRAISIEAPPQTVWPCPMAVMRCV